MSSENVSSIEQVGGNIHAGMAIPAWEEVIAASDFMMGPMREIGRAKLGSAALQETYEAVNQAAEHLYTAQDYLEAGRSELEAYLLDLGLGHAAASESAIQKVQPVSGDMVSGNAEKQPVRMTFYTVTTPDTETYGGGYKRIVGYSLGDTQVWLRGADKENAQPEDLQLDPAMAANAAGYITMHYNKRPGMFRNCHVAAAAVTGKGEVSSMDALAIAQQTIRNGQIAEDDDLPVGARGVIGMLYEGEAVAWHSVIGAAPGVGLQTDGINGDMSLVSHKSNLAEYRKQFPECHLFVVPVAEDPENT